MFYFYIFLIAVTLLGSVIVGPFSIRVYATIGMILYLLLERRNDNVIRINKGFLKVYLIFLILMGIAQLLNGEIFEYEYFKKLLAYHLVCIVTFLTIERNVNSFLDLKCTILYLTLLLIINNITTILQFSGNNLGWVIGSAFGNIESNIDYFYQHDSMLGVSNTPGIFGNVVTNAAAIAIVSPLSLCLLGENSSTLYKVFGLSNLILSSVACFMTQQRTAVVLFGLCVVIFLLVRIKRFFPLIVIALLMVGLFGLSFEITDANMGRLADFSDSDRKGLFSSALDFITTHPLLGGPMSFQRQTGLSSHNVLLDSWIFSGFFGFIAMCILIIKTVYQGIKVFMRGINNQNNYSLFCSLSVLNSMAYGFTHNTSFLTGFVFIFIVLALMLKAEIITQEI